MPYSQNVLSKGMVPVEITDLLATVAQDPTGYPVSLAFRPPGVLPAPTDWVPATWAPSANGSYVAQVRIGPADGLIPVADVTLPVGTYTIWYQLTITDNSGQPQEVLVDSVDTLTITGANAVVPVVTIADLASYMGYPFTPDQYSAVGMALDSLTAQLSNWLKADLSIQQWTETYTVPFEGTTVLNSTVFNTSTADVYFDIDQLNLSYAMGPVRLKHWPIISYDAVFVVNTATTPPTLYSIPSPTPPETLPNFVYGTTVQTTYTAGYAASTMPDIRQAILRAAARELTNRLDDAVGLKGGMAIERLPDGPGPAQTTPGFLLDELMPLSRYKRRTVV